MSLSVEFFKALWLEAGLAYFIEIQNGCGPIFCMAAEYPTEARRRFLEGVLEFFGAEYWREIPICRS